MLKKLLSMTLAMLMVFSLAFPIPVLAEEYFEDFIVEENYEEPVDNFFIEDIPADEEIMEDQWWDAYSDEIEDNFIEDGYQMEEEFITEENEISIEENDTFDNGEELHEFSVENSAVFENVPPATIVEDPESVTAAPGTTASFTVVAENAESYQWWLSQDGGASWVKASSSRYGGVTTATMTVTAKEARNGWQFRCAVTGGGVTVESKAATLTVVGDVTDKNVIYSKLADGTGYYVKQYIGNDSSVVVLNEINGLPVTQIGEEAFMGNTYLMSIDLPDSITVIRARAFKGCTNLREMY